MHFSSSFFVQFWFIFPRCVWIVLFLRIKYLEETQKSVWCVCCVRCKMCIRTSFESFSTSTFVQKFIFWIFYFCFVCAVEFTGECKYFWFVRWEVWCGVCKEERWKNVFVKKVKRRIILFYNIYNLMLHSYNHHSN